MDEKKSVLYRVPFASFRSMEELLKEDYRTAFERVLAKSWYIRGSEDSSFEKRFAEYCGVKYCVGVGNGLDALTLSLKALGIGKGDEVIIPANTYIATALAVINADATPVLADPDIMTLNINPDSNSFTIKFILDCYRSNKNPKKYCVRLYIVTNFLHSRL